MSLLRVDGRTPEQARPLSFERDFTQMAAGSVLVSFGRTRVPVSYTHLDVYKRQA